MSLTALYNAIQEACLPAVWSRGVSLSRSNSVIKDKASEAEIVLRVVTAGRAVHPKVTLWPTEGDWYCDCGDRNDPCLHVAAAILALKANTLASESPRPTSTVARVQYNFFRASGGILHFERSIVSTKPDGTRNELSLNQSLVAYVGGTRSGRIEGPAIAASKDDFAVDQALGSHIKGALSAGCVQRLFAALQNCGNVFLDGLPITISAKQLHPVCVLSDHVHGSKQQGFKLLATWPDGILEKFTTGLALLADGQLRPFSDAGLSNEFPRAFSETGHIFSFDEREKLFGEIVPSLSLKLSLDLRVAKVPELFDCPPRVLLKLDQQANGTLTVLPALTYGEPPFAEVIFGRLHLLSDSKLPRRDYSAEKQLLRRLQGELFLQPDQRVALSGQAAADFLRRAKGWDIVEERRDSRAIYAGRLMPRVTIKDGAFVITFGIDDGAHHQADPEKVLAAWSHGDTYAPLQNGSWAAIPSEWLSVHGASVLALLDAREKNEKLPSYLIPDAIRLAEECGGEAPPDLKRMVDLLENTNHIPESALPDDLTAELREYQRSGVNWLSFLRDAGMGGMLADDMGLGKTLQALCALRGRTLVIAPTSVIHAWNDQIERFRPSLKASIYHGSTRSLDKNADIIITSYGVLRLDQEVLGAENWDTLILDEAQTIRNPLSQVAQAAHRLRGGFRIALSGTPVENRLSDLWSQFQFLNPGLLGSASSFQDGYASAISSGDERALQRLRTRIKPFVLRRLKKDVAAELPPKIETLLQCELSDDERDLYQTVLAASRREIVSKLDSSGGVMAALEALLRLRQACCHPALLPGKDGIKTSSKIELLMETLETSVAEGHKALVFSQWTSFLDLIEPHLADAGIAFSRLDGTTSNRQAVVEEFQKPSGPPVMIISLKAGGLGLTLTSADHVFLLDPWWNPAVEDQAADRAHRIGQNKTVMVHRLIAKDTIEEKVIELQRRKQALAQGILDDGGGCAAGLTKDDILALLN